MPFLTNRLLLFDGTIQVDHLIGDVDPTDGAGVAANVGSLYHRDVGGLGTTGEVWQKTGPLDVDWVLMSASGSIVHANKQRDVFIVGNEAEGDDEYNCDYLETGDGDAIATALASVGASGGTVFVRRGSYPVASTLLIGDNTRLLGDNATLVLANAVQVQVDNANSHVDNVAFCGFTVTAAFDSNQMKLRSWGSILIQDIYWTGTSAAIGIEVDLDSVPTNRNGAVVINRCVFNGLLRGFYAENPGGTGFTGLFITECTYQDCLYSIYNFSMSISNVVIEKNTFRHAIVNVAHVRTDVATSCWQWSVSHNHFYNSAANNTSTPIAFAGTSGGAIEINNNSILEQMTSFAINVSADFEGVKVTNNTCVSSGGTGGGIQVQGFTAGSAVLVSGNHVTVEGDFGIVVNSIEGTVVVHDNEINMASTAFGGIASTNLNLGVTYSNNRISGADASLIYGLFQSVIGLRLLNNTFDAGSADSVGLTINGTSSDIILDGNIFQNFGEEPALILDLDTAVSDASKVLLKDNRFTNCTPAVSTGVVEMHDSMMYAKLDGNIFEGISGLGWAILYEPVADVDTVRIYFENNVFKTVDGAALRFNPWTGIEKFTFRNNTFVNVGVTNSHNCLVVGDLGNSFNDWSFLGNEYDGIYGCLDPGDNSFFRFIFSHNIVREHEVTALSGAFQNAQFLGNLFHSQSFTPTADVDLIVSSDSTVSLNQFLSDSTGTNNLLLGSGSDNHIVYNYFQDGFTDGGTGTVTTGNWS